MDYHSISNPIWTDATRTMVTIDIVFPALGDASVKFNASQNDVMPHGRAIYAELIAGTHGVIAEPTTTSQ
jgi:hypothetical protein